MPMAVASMAATVLTIKLPSAQMRRPLLGFGSEHELPRLPPYISKKQTLKFHTVPAPSTNCNGTSSPSLRAADQICGGRCALEGGLTVAHWFGNTCEACRKRQLCGYPR